MWGGQLIKIQKLVLHFWYQHLDGLLGNDRPHTMSHYTEGLINLSNDSGSIRSLTHYNFSAKG